MAYSSVFETMDHIQNVRHTIIHLIDKIMERALLHDQSKMQTGEVEYFDIFTSKLKDCTYGSEEYKQFLAELKPALDHHYAVSRHHPEHFQDGIRGMNLVDIVEMFCDWYAATKRHKDGDILRSIEINQERFGYSDDLKAVLENTFRDILEKGMA